VCGRGGGRGGGAQRGTCLADGGRGLQMCVYFGGGGRGSKVVGVSGFRDVWIRILGPGSSDKVASALQDGEAGGLILTCTSMFTIYVCVSSHSVPDRLVLT
jgi:hypothetical protein